MVRLLRDAGRCVVKGAVLVTAAGRGDIELVRRLRGDLGVQVGPGVLCAAAKADNVERVEWLAEQGSSPVGGVCVADPWVA